MKLSLILPIYNEQAILAEVLEKYIQDLEICAKELESDIEVIAVNDGCTDASLDILKGYARLNRGFRIVNLDQRYGKQAAITAGFEAASGDVILLADIDLLNPVGVFERIIKEYLFGNDIVYAYRESIGLENLKRSTTDKIVNFATRIFGVSGTYMGKANIMLFSRNVADILREIPNKNKLMRTMDNWVGYEIATIDYSSNYSKVEMRKKMRSAKLLDRRQGQPSVARSTAREHTPSKIYSIAAMLLAAIFLGLWIFVSYHFGIHFVWHIVCVVAFLALVLSSLLFFARSVMIKRVGIVYTDQTVATYVVKSVIN